MKKQHFLKSSWTISVGTTLFSFVLTILYDKLKDKPILSTISEMLNWSLNAIIKSLIFEVKVWWLLVGIVILVLIFHLISQIRNKKQVKPDFCNYRVDKFKRWKWSWNWEWSSSQKAWIIDELKAHCPICDTPLINSSSLFNYSFECPRCDFFALDEKCDKPQKIERIILDNIERHRKACTTPNNN